MRAVAGCACASRRCLPTLQPRPAAACSLPCVCGCCCHHSFLQVHAVGLGCQATTLPAVLPVARWKLNALLWVLVDQSACCRRPDLHQQQVSQPAPPPFEPVPVQRCQAGVHSRLCAAWHSRLQAQKGRGHSGESAGTAYQIQQLQPRCCQPSSEMLLQAGKRLRTHLQYCTRLQRAQRRRPTARWPQLSQSSACTN